LSPVVTKKSKSSGEPGYEFFLN